MISASCLCGAIVFEIEIDTKKVYNCHCSQCRKAHGATFATQVFAKGDTLKFIKGQELLTEYKEKKGVRAFCKQCGSNLMNYAEDKNIYLSVALSSIDGEHGIVPTAHANVESKAAWHNPSLDIPIFSGIPDGAFD